jgi:hypothetical protein
MPLRRQLDRETKNRRRKTRHKEKAFSGRDHHFRK